VYVCVAFFTDEKVPSPNDHLQVAHTAGLLVEASALNVTVRGAVPFAGVAVKLATGAAGGGTFVTLTELGPDTLLPPVFMAVKVTV
jgi:NAD(P)H-dependent flavin oxidoreductase YrpB (nitropropane dioxygenase family)